MLAESRSPKRILLYSYERLLLLSLCNFCQGKKPARFGHEALCRVIRHLKEFEISMELICAARPHANYRCFSCILLFCSMRRRPAAVSRDWLQASRECRPEKDPSAEGLQAHRDAACPLPQSRSSQVLRNRRAQSR